MANVTVSIKGLDALTQKFAQIRAQVTGNGVPSALIDGGKDMAAAIASEAPRSSGFLAQHIDVKFSKKTKNTATVFIAPNTKQCYPEGADKHNKNKKGFPAFTIAWYIQFGHRLRTAILGYDESDYTPKKHKLKKRAKKHKIWRIHGEVAPNPFVTRGFAKAIGAVTAKIQVKLGETVRRIGG